MVLCAGFGTRLRPPHRPRAQTVRPALAASLSPPYNSLAGTAGVREVVVNTQTHHLAAEMGRALSRLPQVGLAARFLPLSWSHPGTGGGVRRAAQLPRAGHVPFLLLNGDMLFDVDLEAAIVAHRARARWHDGARSVSAVRLVCCAGRGGFVVQRARIAGRVRSVEWPWASPRFSLHTVVHVLEKRGALPLPRRESYINRTATCASST